jgi:hypoxanthine phosphoribosyltransferase
MATAALATVEEKFSAERIAARVRELGAEIRRHAGDDEIFLIGVLKGASLLMSDLLRAIPGDVRYDFIDVIRDVSDTEIAAAMEIDFLTHFDIRDRNVYLLKDVVATGVIENYLLTQLRQRGPARISLVALIDRSDQRTVEIEVDFRMFEAPSALYAGYGLEYEGRFGNLPYLGVIRTR